MLSKYFEILDDERRSKYLICKDTKIDFDEREETNSLWKKHDEGMRNIGCRSGSRSLLELKIELANRIFNRCHFCEHRCGVDRQIKKGICGVKESKVASEFIHYGEETILVPSYTIFFSGCPFHCVYCQNWDISQRITGIYIHPEKLSMMIRRANAINVNWVGGDPTPNLLYILKVLNECDRNIPQIWNSNMYCSIETMKLLHGVIDIYLTDFKYGNDECAERLSKVKNYLAIMKRNHLIAYGQGEMIIRHLTLPNHVKCCSIPILKWISENLPDAAVNIMDQYRPLYKAYKYEDISRNLSREEYLSIYNYGKKLGLKLI